MGFRARFPLDFVVLWELSFQAQTDGVAIIEYHLRLPSFFTCYGSTSPCFEFKTGSPSQRLPPPIACHPDVALHVE